MSGGSFDYLYNKEADYWVGGQCSSDAQRMIDALIAAGAEDAAKETQTILAIADGARVRLEALIEHIGPLWKAMEWWKSGDSREANFTEALEKWRDGREW